eukprot:3350907-Pleurochrysis_carterae.AAC.1
MCRKSAGKRSPDGEMDRSGTRTAPAVVSKPPIVVSHASAQHSQAVASQAYHELSAVIHAQIQVWTSILKRRRISTCIFIAGSLVCLIMPFVPSQCITSDSPEIGEICMEGDAWLTLWVTLVSLLLMANDCAPDLVLLGTTTFLLLCKIIGQEEAWEGFSSDSILAIGALFVLARALEETRAAERLLRPFLGNPKNHREALARLCFPCGGMSMVMNNTPIVAMLLTVCENWAARNGLCGAYAFLPVVRLHNFWRGFGVLSVG